MKLLYFDYAAIVVLALLVFTTYCRGLTKGKLNRCYMQMIVVGLITAMADILAAYGDNMAITNMPFRYAAHCVYLLMHSATTPLFVIYLMIVTDTDYKMRRLKSLLYTLPYLVIVVLMCSNPVTHWIYYINEDLEYVRGSLFGVLYVTAFIYTYLSLHFLIKYGKTIGFRRTLGLGSMIPFMLAAMAIQYFKPDILAEMFANAIALLLISSLIHRPEDILDTETGFSNRTACFDDITRCIQNKKPLEVIIINITNYDSLSTLFDANGVHKLHRQIAAHINNINKTRDWFSEMFYVGNGILYLEMNYLALKDTEIAANELNKFFLKPLVMNGMEINMTAYVCVAKCPEDIPDVDALSRFTDKLPMLPYTGSVIKASEVYKKDQYDLMRNMDSIIENALSNHLFQVYYQPIYSIKEKRFNSAEALIRLIDEKYGFISPEIFIPIAEKSGAIHKIGAYVLDEVCAFIESDEFKKLKLDYIEVNLSVVQCMRNDLTEEILEIMKRHNVSSSQINLEITETTASYSQDALQENVKNLLDAGINFSLDDYGTGYSNIERISSMVFELVKLDKSFANVLNNKNHDVVLAHTVSMIKELGMKIVVEGVETKDLLDRFSELGCDYIQGFYFSKPVPRNDFIEFIKASQNK